MDVANRCIERKVVEEVVCVFIERDPVNFANLKEVVEREEHNYPYVEVLPPINDEFATVVSDIIEKVGARLAPSFFFIDPFGFTGVPFSLVKDILSIPRAEVFFTFMYRDINRFKNSPNCEALFDELFGTGEWRGKQQHELRDLYIRQLREEAGACFTWDFRMCQDEKVQTLYYLIHATNHFKGLKYMKEVMCRQGPEGLFAFLGPDEFVRRHQMKLFSNDIPSLRNFFLTRFAGQTVKYEQIQEVTYLETPLIDKHSNEAIKQLETEGRVTLNGKGPRGGIKENTRVTFPSN